MCCALKFSLLPTIVILYESRIKVIENISPTRDDSFQMILIILKLLLFIVLIYSVETLGLF